MAIEKDSQRMSSLKVDNVSIGQGGSDFISDTALHSPAADEIYFAVQCITETTFAVLTDNTRGGNTMTGVAIPAGTVFYGAIEGIDLTSGSCIAYKAQYKAGG